jgi:hypothetical protein
MALLRCRTAYSEPDPRSSHLRQPNRVLVPHQRDRRLRPNIRSARAVQAGPVRLAGRRPRHLSACPARARPPRSPRRSPAHHRAPLQILAVELSARESRSSWGGFLRRLIARGLHGVELVVADDHAGLRDTLPEAAYQRCHVQFLGNALDHLPRKADDDGLQDLRGSTTVISPRPASPRRLAREVGGPLPAPDRLGRGDRGDPHLLPPAAAPSQHLKSTNMLERLNEEIKRRTHVVRIFPNAASCLRLVRALAVASCRTWRTRPMIGAAHDRARYRAMRLLLPSAPCLLSAPCSSAPSGTRCRHRDPSGGNVGRHARDMPTGNDRRRSQRPNDSSAIAN